MKDVQIIIKPIKKEISIEIPMELRRKLSKEELDEINLKIFGVSAMLSDVAKR
ncbi:MAG: hypothetical protein ACRC7N_04050 [Clostridium sp.]